MYWPPPPPSINSWGGGNTVLGQDASSIKCVLLATVVLIKPGHWTCSRKRGTIRLNIAYLFTCGPHRHCVGCAVHWGGVVWRREKRIYTHWFSTICQLHGLNRVKLCKRTWNTTLNRKSKSSVDSHIMHFIGVLAYPCIWHFYDFEQQKFL